jgi:putative endonuclease
MATKNLLPVRDSSPEAQNDRRNTYAIFPQALRRERHDKQFYVYIMSNKSRSLYTGVTNDLERRIYEHKQKLVPGFTAKYNITRLVYFEVTEDVGAAIAREKQIKGWLRIKKIALIESMNPKWTDLSARWSL